jgi:hypothetical protein
LADDADDVGILESAARGGVQGLGVVEAAAAAAAVADVRMMMMTMMMMFWLFVVFVLVLIVVSVLSLCTLLWLLRGVRMIPYGLVARQGARGSNHPIRLSNVRHLAVVLEGQELKCLTALDRMLCKLHLAVNTPEALPVG